jgi:hypothetical protein
MFRLNQMVFASDVIRKIIRNNRTNLPFTRELTTLTLVMSQELPQLEPIEEMLIARVHVSINEYSVNTSPQSYPSHILYLF